MAFVIQFFGQFGYDQVAQGWSGMVGCKAEVLLVFSTQLSLTTATWGVLGMIHGLFIFFPSTAGRESTGHEPCLFIKFVCIFFLF